MATHLHGADHHGSPDLLLESALSELQRREERTTPARRAVLRVLAEHSRHLSAEEIAELLAGEEVHRATVFRTLERFAELGLVSVRRASGEPASYHLSGGGHLHGHCRGCERVVALPIDALEPTATMLAERSGFRLEAQRSTIVGLCASCLADGVG